MCLLNDILFNLPRRSTQSKRRSFQYEIPKIFSLPCSKFHAWSLQTAQSMQTLMTTTTFSLLSTSPSDFMQLQLPKHPLLLPPSLMPNPLPPCHPTIPHS